MLRLASLPADVEALLGEFATALQAAFDEADTGLTVPAHRYLNPGGQVAWDEPQLTAVVLRIYMGEPGALVSGSLIAGQFHQSVSIGIAYIETIPSLTDTGLPATTDLDAAGQAIVGLLPIFWQTAIALRVSGSISEGGGSVAIGPLTTIGPEGGLAGISLQIDASVL